MHSSRLPHDLSSLLGWLERSSLVMAVYVPLLQQYLARPPCAAPSSSIALPDGLRNELEAQHSEVATDTLANGNCGIDAFGISLIEEANRNRALYCTNKY